MDAGITNAQTSLYIELKAHVHIGRLAPTMRLARFIRGNRIFNLCIFGHFLRKNSSSLRVIRPFLTSTVTISHDLNTVGGGEGKQIYSTIRASSLIVIRDINYHPSHILRLQGKSMFVALSSFSRFHNFHKEQRLRGKRKRGFRDAEKKAAARHAAELTVKFSPYLQTINN